MVILYLYAELMGYNIPVLKELSTTHNATIHVVCWDKKKLTPFEKPEIDGVSFYNRSEFDKHTIIDLANRVKPNLVYVPNWYDKGYLPVCKMLKKKGIPVVAGLDNQWTSSLKQWVGCVYMRLYLKNFFSHLWVAGPYQYEFARRLGFEKNDILHDFYSADVELFSKYNIQSQDRFNKKFLFVGRFEPVKGIDLLIKAWNAIADKDGWDLTLIGNGSLNDLLKDTPGITIRDFMQPEVLAKEISNYGCFILPSVYEPYGVVLHEFAVAGMPIIASDTCGASPIFVRDGLNGFQFKTGNHLDLQLKMEKIIGMSQVELKKMSSQATQRGNHITPQSSAASLISALR